MLSIEPANGAFFADPEKPVAQPAPQPAAPEAPAIPSATHDAAAAASAAMIDVPLGTLIFRAGLLGEEQLEDALREGMSSGRRLGEVLIERGWIQERELGRLLAGQKGLPFVEVSASDVEPAALEALSEVNAKLQIALPLRHEDGRLVVAVADPSNELMLENLRRTLGAPPEIVVAPHAELVKAIGEAYATPRQQAVPESEAVVSEPETLQLEVLPEAQPELELELEPEPEPQAQAEAERAPVRPLPIMLRPPRERTVETPSAPAKFPSPPMLRAPVAPPPVEDTPEVEAPAVQPAPEATPDPEPQAAEVQQAPEPELILELPPDWPSAGEDPAEAPAAPAPAEEPAPEPPAQEEPASPTAVVLRLRDGATLEVGTFPTAAEAASEAQEVVIEIAAADRNSTWPFFAQRYLRPDLIISVDLIEQSSDRDGLRRSQR